MHCHKTCMTRVWSVQTLTDGNTNLTCLLKMLDKLIDYSLTGLKLSQACCFWLLASWNVSMNLVLVCDEGLRHAPAVGTYWQYSVLCLQTWRRHDRHTFCTGKQICQLGSLTMMQLCPQLIMQTDSFVFVMCDVYVCNCTAYLCLHPWIWIWIWWNDWVPLKVLASLRTVWIW